MVGFYVVGEPAPMGSKKHVGGGRMVESSKKVAPWRTDVANAASAFRPPEPLDGPLRATMVFTLRRPKSAPKRRRHPDTKPDLDKLVRATCDALTTASIWADDARLVNLAAQKVWWGYHPWALPVTGAIIVVSAREDYDHVSDVEQAVLDAHAALHVTREDLADAVARAAS